MRIAIDFVHPADVNFFKNAINLIIQNGDDVFLTVRSRGILVSILQKEIGMPINIIGNHQSSIIGKVVYTIIRDFNLLSFYKKNNIDISMGFSPHTCRASKVLGIPSVVFDDDYVYKLTFTLQKLFATRLIIPKSIPAFGKNIYKYNGFKELAYLHPLYYTSTHDILDEYGLKKNEYIFIREISGISLDYRNAVSDLRFVIKELINEGFKIVLSLEDKSRKDLFSENCIILEEPVGDIYSLLKYSALTISAGDTMAREATLLGTPSIYTGGRVLPVDSVLIENRCMYKIDELSNIVKTTRTIIRNDVKKDVGIIINHKIKHEWENTTEVILKHLYGFLKKMT